MRHSYEQLLENNREWADERMKSDPSFFERMAAGQKPPFLFIGCCDSRKPLDTITQSEPGELFIHRNIANQVSLADENVLAVIEFAVEALEVEHLIVCGHTGCGGVMAALGAEAPSRVMDWVSPVRELYQANRKELDAIESIQERADRLAEMNAVNQVHNVFRTSTVRRALARGKAPRVHAWIFDLRNGYVRDLDLPLDAWVEEGLLPADYARG